MALTVAGTREWGSASTLDNLDIAKLPNATIKRHLEARSEPIEGSKIELIERLKNSLEAEKQRELELVLEAKHKQIAHLEEQGSLYVVGKNHVGQLGLGDRHDRKSFTVIPMIRNVTHVSTSTGANMSLATTEQHEVFVFGGGGMGPMGLKGKHRADTPQLVVKLNGEEIVTTSTGSNHAVAISDGGDVFSWGKGDFGVLGTGDTTSLDTPKFLDCFIERVTVVSTSCGEHHTCIKTSTNVVYAWGHTSNGRLGLGRCKEGAPIFQPSPLQVQFPSPQQVKQIACGSEHTLAATSSGIFSWGSGDGGKLGHSTDLLDRWEPTEIMALKGSHILDISASVWHSACVICVPPMREAGYLYMFGSGYQGQLGLGKTCQTSIPTLVEAFCTGQVMVKTITCGSSHNAAITSDGNLWTWGSNKHGALGRNTGGLTFTPDPGLVAEFGTIVNRIGRGLPRSVGKSAHVLLLATLMFL